MRDKRNNEDDVTERHTHDWNGILVTRDAVEAERSQDTDPVTY